MRFQEITSHIPHIMQTLYTPNVLQSVTLEEIRDAFRPQQITDKSWLLQQMVGVDIYLNLSHQPFINRIMDRFHQLLFIQNGFH